MTKRYCAHCDRPANTCNKNDRTNPCPCMCHYVRFEDLQPLDEPTLWDEFNDKFGDIAYLKDNMNCNVHPYQIKEWLKPKLREMLEELKHLDGSTVSTEEVNDEIDELIKKLDL